MPYVDFHKHFPKIAEQETRIVTIFDDAAFGLPAGHYTFFELFCDEPGCDCRRVFFAVASSHREIIEAVIAYGWESPEFYARWMGSNDSADIAALKGPVLNLASPQSDLAPAILELARKLLLSDETYIERVKQHYKFFRDKVDKKTRSRPLKKKLRKKKKRKS
jgi:hypothetical protein